MTTRIHRDSDIQAACSDENYTSRVVATPESQPDHPVVGHEFMAHGHELNEHKTTRWFCIAKDQGDYWMVSTDGHGVWTSVSDRAIDRTFHTIWKDYDGSDWSRWGRAMPYKGTPAYDAWVARRKELGQLYA